MCVFRVHICRCLQRDGGRTGRSFWKSSPVSRRRLMRSMLKLWEDSVHSMMRWRKTWRNTAASEPVCACVHVCVTFNVKNLFMVLKYQRNTYTIILFWLFCVPLKIKVCHYLLPHKCNFKLINSFSPFLKHKWRIFFKNVYELKGSL